MIDVDLIVEWINFSVAILLCVTAENRFDFDGSANTTLLEIARRNRKQSIVNYCLQFSYT